MSASVMITSDQKTLFISPYFRQWTVHVILLVYESATVAELQRFVTSSVVTNRNSIA
jgi:hypothetical protein